MRSPSQIAASRSNGAKSKGPVSAQGKRNSSRNALRHGMFADTIVLEAEDPAQFLELVNELWQDHQPQTATEEMLLYTIAAARWRQTRIWGMQKVALDYDVVNAPAGSPILNPLRAVLSLRASPECVRAHEFLLRSEIAADRQISRCLHRLQQLQQKRTAQNSAPAERTQQPIEKPHPDHRECDPSPADPAHPTAPLPSATPDRTKLITSTRVSTKPTPPKPAM